MIGLREEEPALGEQARVLHDERGRRQPRRGERDRHRESRREESHFTLRSASGPRPWKNSRVLNEPAMAP